MEIFRCFDFHSPVSHACFCHHCIVIEIHSNVNGSLDRLQSIYHCACIWRHRRYFSCPLIFQGMEISLYGFSF